MPAARDAGSGPDPATESDAGPDAEAEPAAADEGATRFGEGEQDGWVPA
jgi:hypothetical protein